MKIEIQKEALEAAVSIASKATRKANLPILSGILIQTSDNGIIFTGSDGTTMIQTIVPLISDNGSDTAKIHQAGAIVLPAKLFDDLTSKLPQKIVHIETNEVKATIVCGKTEFNLIGLDPAEYPILACENEAGALTLKSQTLESLIAQTRFCCSTNETTPILSGVLFTIKDGHLTMTSCDRHRFAKKALQVDSIDDVSNIVIRSETLGDISKILTKSEEVTISFGSTVSFKTNNTIIRTRIINGTYPKMNNIADSKAKYSVLINRKEMFDSIERAYMLSREDKSNIIRIMISENSLEVSAEGSGSGKYNEVLFTIESTGEPCQIALNAKYVLDSLKSIQSESVWLDYSEKLKPVFFRPHEDDSLVQLILPYRF